MAALSRSVAWLAVLATGCVGGGGLADPPHGRGAQPIVSGEDDPADPAVVALMYLGQQYCTGTVVTSRVVVTAAHCLPPHIAFEVSDLEVYFGSRIDEPGELVGAIDATVHPDWNEETVANDIGLLALAADAPAAPVRMLLPDQAARVGESARLVGFGVTEAEAVDNGVKRVGRATIRAAESSTIYLEAAPALTCNGDSGGPMFVERDGEQVIAGIHSRSDCANNFLNERIDVHLASEIAPFIARHDGGSCPADGTCDEDCTFDADCGGLEPTASTARTIEGGCAAGGGVAGAGVVVAALAATASLAGRRRRRASR